MTWYKVERQETRYAKSEGWWYFTPKSSTTKTKVIERVVWRKRPGGVGLEEVKGLEKRDKTEI